MTTGTKVQVTLKHISEHGTWLYRFLGIRGQIVSVDGRDSDGEQVFGVRFGRDYATLAESQMQPCK